MSETLEQYLMKKADILQKPISGNLELTPLCNLHCKMCYIHHTPEEARMEGGILPIEFWIELGKQMKDAGVLFLNLIGGEIFVYPYLQRLYLYLISSGFRVSFTTNGTLLSTGIPEWLKKNPPRYVTVSLYGGSDETYKKVCGIKDAYTHVKKGIENLLNEGVKVKLNYCVIPDNVKDIEQIFLFAKERNLKINASSYIYPPVRVNCHKSSDFKRFSPKEAAIVDFDIKKFSLSKEEFLEYKKYLASNDFLMNTPKHCTKFWCRAGKSSFWINWKGKMTSCGMLEVPFADLSVLNFSQAWELVKNQINTINTSKKCATCNKREICRICPAILFAENGTFEKKADYMCEFTKELVQYAKLELK